MTDTVFVHPLGVEVSRKEFSRFRAELAQYNRSLPARLTPQPMPGLDATFSGVPAEHPPIRAWLSQTHLAMLFRDGTPLRLSVCRARLDDTGHYEAGLTWDELMQVKREAGFEDAWAVEIYPPDRDVVNVANMRHLWLLSEPPAYGWHTSQAEADADVRGGAA